MPSKFRKKRFPFYSLFFTVTMVIVVPLSILLVFFLTVSSSIVQEDYVSLNRQSVEKICDTLDNSLNARSNLAYMLSCNQHIKILSTSSWDLSTADLRDSCENVSDFLQSAHTYYGHIFPHSAVYFPDRKSVVGITNPLLSPETFYKQYIQFGDMTASEFYQIVLSVEKGGFYLPIQHSYAGNGSLGDLLVYIHPITSDHIHPRAYFITLINVRNLSNLILSHFDPGTHFSLRTSDGTQILASDGIPDSFTSQTEHQSVLKNNNKTYYVFRSTNAQSALTYTFFIPQASVLKQLSTFLQMWFVALGACLIIGLLLARSIARRIYTPFQTLLYEAFPDGVDDYAHSIQDEVALVAGKIRADQTRSRQTESELRTYYDSMRTTMLMRLLTSSANMPTEMLQESAEMADLPTTHAIYRAAMFEHPSNDIAAPFDMQSLTGCNVRSVRFSSSQCLFLLISTPQSLDEDTDMFFAALSSAHPQGVHIGVSCCYDDPRMLQRCLSEASAACRHHLRSEDPYVAYDTLLAKAETFDYPAEKEMQILAAVRSGNLEETCQLLTEIRDTNLHSRRLVPSMTRLLYSSMIATAFKAYDQLQTEAPQILLENLQTLATLQERRETEELIFDEILRCYTYLCEVASQSNQHKNHQVIENVLAYLETCYSNSSLCLDMVADHLGVSYYFLSRIFKEETNKSFSDMLNDIRIRHAMDLLSETQNAVQDISIQVGYTNWSTFLRAFRKRTGTTPVQYRKDLTFSAN